GVAGGYRPDRPARGRLERSPQIVGRGVAVGMRRHVLADAVAERLGAEIALDVPDQRLALLVGDRVEGDHRLAFVGGRLADRMAGAPRIGIYREFPGAEAVAPHRPAGIEVIGGLGLHPAGEALVE